MTNPKSHKTKTSTTQDWPELAPVRAGLTPDQALAKENLKLQGEAARRPLISRSKALLAATILLILIVIQTAIYVLPPFWQRQIDPLTALFAIVMILDGSAAAYFWKAKDPHFAAQLLKGVITINSLCLLLGLSRLVALPLLLIALVLLVSAYERIKQLASLEN